MKYTLIEMVQRILESMDSDEVNSYSDTPESLAVANILKECYFDIVGEHEFTEHQGLFQLTASGDNLKPTYMTVPSNVADIYKISYNVETGAEPKWRDMNFVTFDEFIRRTNSGDVDNTNVDTQTLTIDGISLVTKIYNDRDPEFYTSPNDSDIIFNAYDSSKESTLQTSKTLGTGLLIPTWTMSNTFTPDLDARQFQLLLQAAKAQAFVELKQIQNPKAETKERRNKILALKQKDTVDNRSQKQRYTGYGRK